MQLDIPSLLDIPLLMKACRPWEVALLLILLILILIITSYWYLESEHKLIVFRCKYRRIETADGVVLLDYRPFLFETPVVFNL